MWRVCRQLASHQTTHPLGHIQSKTLEPDLTRAKAGRPPTRTHANSHLMATPGHQSCCYGACPTVVIARGPPARRSQRGTFLAPLSLQWARPWGSLMGHGPWSMDRGPWLMGHRTMCRCHPTTGIHPCAVAFFLPFPTRSPSGVHSVP